MTARWLVGLFNGNAPLKLELCRVSGADTVMAPDLTELDETRLLVVPEVDDGAPTDSRGSSRTKY